ncbi:hypothetical protein PGIGA_G00233820 [Pangasianodon gigas]|uniref:Uncharacterized protein n=1 Tax=Pangasianodon gigas TaxID=30993 RepID=A0ACC5WLI1_PANGG|nr:hypothetical protein [Pangasianodon gigas]
MALRCCYAAFVAIHTTSMITNFGQSEGSPGMLFYSRVHPLQPIKKLISIALNWDLIVESVIPQDHCVHCVDQIRFGPHKLSDEMSLCFTPLLMLDVFFFFFLATGML